MRVTRAIREYVEEEIYKKYDEAKAKIGVEYEAEKEAATNAIIKIMNEAGKKATDYLVSLGYDVDKSYRSESIFYIAGSFKKKDIEDEIWKQKREVDRKAHEKVKQVLFDLEMGETEKKELKDVLDAIVVD